jgi:bacillithiol synthase
MFEKQQFPFATGNVLNTLVTNYLEEDNSIKPFYQFSPNEIGLKECEKAYTHFSKEQRNLLVKTLIQQAETVNNTSDLTKQNISLLTHANTYTVTTGHQLCLFTGPLYFIYKILSTINLAETLKLKSPQSNYVPVYWMATEDHDIAEVQSFTVFGKKINWETQQQGAVGNLSTEGMMDVLAQLKMILGESEIANDLIALFEKAYIQQKTWANAMRVLVNELFGKYGLIIVDGNDAAFKQTFISEFKKDIFEQKANECVTKTITQLENLNYTIQVKSRPINVFYMDKDLRARIEKKNNNYEVIGTALSFTEQELLTALETETHKFSPNVVLRPLYQQKLLPNIAYVGGPGELAYWLEYKHLFESFEITPPVLLPRQFVSIIDKNSLQKIEKLGLESSLFFKEEKMIVDSFLQSKSSIFDLTTETKNINTLFDTITQRISTIDKSLEGAVAAERQKTLSSLDILTAKTNKALKQKSEQEIKQIQSIKAKLFPENTPQERIENFAQYALKKGVVAWINAIKENLSYSLSDYKLTVLKEL